MRVFALVDCNAFYCSCERHPLWRPDLAGKPMAVMSNNDGCVIARTKELKALQVPMGAPFFQVRDFFQANGVAVFSSNYTLYDDLSSRVMMTLADMVPELEVYSIDEMFAELTGMPVDFEVFGRAMKDRVGRWVGIPVGVGIGATKTLAKACQWASKARPEARGVVVALDAPSQERLLREMPVGEVWGIGRRWAERLNGMGILTAHDLALADPQALGKRFSVVMQRTILELRGVPCADLQLSAPPKQQIISSRMFGRRQSGWAPIAEAVAAWTARAAEKLRAQGSLCKQISVGLLIRAPGGGAWGSQSAEYEDSWYGGTGRLVEPSDDPLTLQGAALKIAERYFMPHAAYTKVSVTLGEISQPQDTTRDLFSTQPTHSPLGALLDQINGKYGRGTLRSARVPRTPNWGMERSMLSPLYTTCRDELPRVR